MIQNFFFFIIFLSFFFNSPSVCLLYLRVWFRISDCKCDKGHLTADKTMSEELWINPRVKNLQFPARFGHKVSFAFPQGSCESKILPPSDSFTHQDWTETSVAQSVSMTSTGVLWTLSLLKERVEFLWLFLFGLFAILFFLIALFSKWSLPWCCWIMVAALTTPHNLYSTRWST